MCFTLLAAGAAMAGSGLQAFGQIQSGKSKAGALEDQASMLDRQAEQHREVAADNLRELVRQAEEDVGASRVAAAKSGVRVGAGSAGRAEDKIREDYRRTAERYGKDLAIEEENLLAEATLLRKGAGEVKRASSFQALGTGIGGAVEGLGGVGKWRRQKKEMVDTSEGGFWDRFFRGVE